MPNLDGEGEDLCCNVAAESCHKWLCFGGDWLVELFGTSECRFLFENCSITVFQVPNSIEISSYVNISYRLDEQCNMMSCKSSYKCNGTMFWKRLVSGAIRKVGM